MAKMRGIWAGDAVATTGFSRVSHSIIKNLPKRSYEIHHLGINYRGDPHPYDHYIYPAILGGDVWGMGRIQQLIDGLKPDFIFFLNDPWVIDMYLDRIKDNEVARNIPKIAYFPVDADEHSPSFYKNFDMIDQVCVYTEFGKETILKTGSPNLNENKINVIPHGINPETFFPMDSTSAKQEVYPQEKIYEFLNSFIIFNGNRNQPRKRIDLTVWAFAEFQKNKPDVKLYLHMGVQDMGFHILELANRYGFDDKLAVSSLGHSIQTVSDQALNLIYNATDIGINTAIGEGWGLVNWEHAATGKPQIVPDNSVLREIWEEKAILVPCKERQMIERVNTVGRVPELPAIIAALEWGYDDWKNNNGIGLQKLGQKGYDLTQEERFSWKVIGKQFNKVIRKAIKK